MDLAQALLSTRDQAPVRLLDGYGGSVRAACHTLAPQSTDELASLLARANREGSTVALRGAGRSYGDAALGSDGLVLDINGLD